MMTLALAKPTFALRASVNNRRVVVCAAPNNKQPKKETEAEKRARSEKSNQVQNELGRKTVGSKSDHGIDAHSVKYAYDEKGARAEERHDFVLDVRAARAARKGHPEAMSDRVQQKLGMDHNKSDIMGGQLNDALKRQLDQSRAVEALRAKKRAQQAAKQQNHPGQPARAYPAKNIPQSGNQKRG